MTVEEMFTMVIIGLVIGLFINAVIQSYRDDD